MTLICHMPSIVLGTGDTELKDLFAGSSLSCRRVTRSPTVLSWSVNVVIGPGSPRTSREVKLI